MARCLVAGCGYVGTALAVLLRDAGHGVFGLKRRPEGLPEGVTPLAADLAELVVARPGVRRRRAVVRVDVHVGVAIPDLLDQVSERRPEHRACQVARRNGSLGKHSAEVALLGGRAAHGVWTPRSLSNDIVT